MQQSVPSASGSSDVRGQGLFAQLQWTPLRVAVAVLLSLFFIHLCIQGGEVLRTQFPSRYIWSDLFISYEGGPVRRGLLGEIGYLLQSLISVQILFTVLVVVFYAATCVALIVLACGQFRLSGLLAVLSPAALLLPMLNEALGRKEVFFILAFLVCVYAVCRMRRAELALAILMAVYLVMGLIHELAWIYFPLAVAVLFHTSARDKPLQWLIRATVASAVYLAVMAVITILTKGDEAQVVAMIDAWQKLVPGAFEPRGAAGFLGLGPEQSLPVTWRMIASRFTLTGYAIAFVLALIPTGVWFIERRLVPHPVLGYWGWMVAVAIMMLAFLLGHDWGRFIHILVLHLAIVQLTVGEKVASYRTTASPADDGRRLAIWAVPVVYFATSWALAHFVPRPENPLHPGILFSIHK